MYETRLFYASGALYAELTPELHSYFYENGTVKTVERYKEGRLDGEVLLYWPNGQRKRKSFFIRGVREGLDQMWNCNGQLVDEGSYEAGRAVGVHRRFREDGVLIEEARYIDRARFDLRSWDETGQLRLEALWEGLTYLERSWNRSKSCWMEKRGHWDGAKIVYASF
ncbi:MAG: hypothetical protein HY861_00020 [Chlamydiia bacterium]|nr:hypothetical protein [Chlamydiia bacterium]